MKSKLLHSTSLALSLSVFSQSAVAQSTWTVSQDPISGQTQVAYLDGNGQPTQVNVSTLFSDQQMDKLLTYFDGTMTKLDSTLNKTVDGSLSIADRAVTVGETFTNPRKVAALSFAAAAGGALGAAAVNYGLDLLAKGLVLLWKEASGESKREHIAAATKKYEAARKAYLDGTEAVDALEKLLHQSNQLMNFTLSNLGILGGSSSSLSEKLGRVTAETEDSIAETENSIRGENSGLYSDPARLKALRAQSRDAHGYQNQLKNAANWINEELPRACRESAQSKEKVTSIFEGLHRARFEILENQKLAREGLYRRLREDDRKLMRNYRSGAYSKQSYQMDQTEIGRLRFRSRILAEASRSDWDQLCRKTTASGSLSQKRASCRKLWNTAPESQPENLRTLKNRWAELSLFSDQSVERLMQPFSDHRERQKALAVIMREDVLAIYQRQISHLDFLDHIEAEYAGRDGSGLSEEIDQFVKNCQKLGISR